MHKEQPSPEILEMANLGAAAKTEHYEMAMYTALVQMAKDLGETDAAQLLQDNLDQEKEMAVRVETLARELGKHADTARHDGRRPRRPPLVLAPAPGRPGHRDDNSTPVQTTRRSALLPVGGWSFSSGRRLRSTKRQQ